MVSFLTILIVAALVGLDQLFKHWVTAALRPDGIMSLIPGVLQFHYSENDGAMMGLFGGKTGLMIVLAALLLIALLYVIFSKRLKPGVLYGALVLVFAGGIGNMIDRVARGFVVDYIEVLFVQFYIFNFADCLITVGAFTILIYEIYETVRDSKRKKAQRDG